LRNGIGGFAASKSAASWKIRFLVFDADTAEKSFGPKIQVKLDKYLRSMVQWQFRPPQVELARPLEQLGSEYGGYFIDVTILPPAPVIYSLGIGEDISFELALMKKGSFSVHAFDPTPKVRTWLDSQNMPDSFHFHPVGIANVDGNVDFYLPPSPDFISHSMIAAKQYSGKSIQVPMARLSTAMRQLGHKRVDLLKMDVEGAEYGILADIVKQQVDVTQIAVEFHHRLSGVGVQRTRDVLADLHDYGMRLSYVCPRFEVMTLTRLC
jgi:FkbM family methyltransferase